MYPEKTALLLIGYQNDYFAKRGVLHHMAESVTGFDTALGNTLHLLENIVSMPILIVSTPIAFSPDYGELTNPVGALKIIKERGAFQRGAWGAETIPELRAFGGRIIEVPGKLGLNAFSDTELDAVLRRHRIEHLIIAGVLTLVCVDSTGRGAVERGYRAIILSDCTFGRTDFEQYLFCKRIFPLYAQVMDHRQLLQSTRSNHWQLVNEVSRMDDVEAEMRLHFLDELVATEERYKGLIERLSNIVFRYDDKGVLTYVNPAWQELLGYAPSESMGRSLMDLVYPEDRRIGWEELSHQALQEPYRMRLFHHRGHVRWYELSLYPDSRSGGVGLLYDITSEQENEDRSARERVDGTAHVQDRFMAAMGHEIRTPVSTIVGMTNLLLQTQLDEKQRGQLEMVQDTGYFLLRVLDDILRFSRIEAGELVLGMCPMEPRMVIREALDLSFTRAEEQGLELSVRVESDVPEMVMGDPECLREVLVKLVGNAVKFTPEGRITIALKVTAAQEGHEAEGDDEWLLEFAVQDTGIGIPAGQQGLLFEPFFQVEQSANSRKMPGAGLGLAIAARLVELMGGALTVESTPEVGSTFRFILPMPLSEPLPEPSPDQPPEDGE